MAKVISARRAARSNLLAAATEALEWARLIERVTNHGGDAQVVSAARQLLSAIETRAVQLAQAEAEERAR